MSVNDSDNTLPLIIRGQRSRLLISTLLALFFIFGGLLVLALVVKNNDSPGLIIISLFFWLMGIIIAYDLIRSFPKTIIFEAERITWYGIAHRRYFAISQIQSAGLRKLITRTKNQTQTQLWLVLYFQEGSELIIPEYYISGPLPILLQSLTGHYGLEYDPGRYEQTLHHREFALGSNKPFKYYFSSQSNVPVTSITDICNWLSQCDYVNDQQQFGKKDYWQHPAELEQNRKGDCEDFALWAWRKLADLNIPAEFVVGKYLGNEPEPGTHAWVTYRSGRDKFLLEPTARTKPMILPLASAVGYQPRYSIDHHYKTYSFFSHSL